jgi:hypothetical protein
MPCPTMMWVDEVEDRPEQVSYCFKGLYRRRVRDFDVILGASAKAGIKGLIYALAGYSGGVRREAQHPGALW